MGPITDMGRFATYQAQLLTCMQTWRLATDLQHAVVVNSLRTNDRGYWIGTPWMQYSRYPSYFTDFGRKSSNKKVESELRSVQKGRTTVKKEKNIQEVVQSTAGKKAKINLKRQLNKPY